MNQPKLSTLNPLKTLYLQQLNNTIPMGFVLCITELLFTEDTSSKFKVILSIAKLINILTLMAAFCFFRYFVRSYGYETLLN